MEMKLNFMAILIAVGANFIFGFIWYTPLFGKAWAKELGFDMSVKPPASALIKGMVVMVIGNFLMAWVLAHNCAAWTFVPGMDAMSPTAAALSAAIFTWLGFFVPGDLSRVVWEMRSWKFFFIQTGYHLGMLLIAAFILCMMPAK
jgi:hypothetical protein